MEILALTGRGCQGIEYSEGRTIFKVYCVTHVGYTSEIYDSNCIINVRIF